MITKEEARREFEQLLNDSAIFAETYDEDEFEEWYEDYFSEETT